MLRRWLHLCRTLLRELADENAYERYLQTQGVEASAQEWRRFSDRRLRRRYGQAKCC